MRKREVVSLLDRNVGIVETSTPVGVYHFPGVDDGWVEKLFRSGSSMKFVDDMEFAGDGVGSYVYAVGTAQGSMIVRADGDGDAGERLRDGFRRLQEGIRHGGQVLGLGKKTYEALRKHVRQRLKETLSMEPNIELL